MTDVLTAAGLGFMAFGVMRGSTPCDLRDIGAGGLLILVGVILLVVAP